MRRPTCRSHRRARTAGGVDLPLATAILSVLLRTEPFGVHVGVAVLWLDRDHRLLDQFAVRAEDADLEEICRPVLDTRSSPVGAVVLGTALPLGRRRPGKPERRRFRELRDRHAEAGVELMDWIVLGPGRTWSMAEEVRHLDR